jgi:hypothetical protein
MSNYMGKKREDTSDWQILETSAETDINDSMQILYFSVINSRRFKNNSYKE